MRKGIYILHSLGEYRVSYVENINSIYAEYDAEEMKFKLKPGEISRLFKSASVLKSINEAVEFAKKLSSLYVFDMDDGIMNIVEISDKKFEEFIDEKCI